MREKSKRFPISLLGFLVKALKAKSNVAAWREVLFRFYEGVTSHESNNLFMLYGPTPARCGPVFRGLGNHRVLNYKRSVVTATLV